MTLTWKGGIRKLTHGKEAVSAGQAKKKRGGGKKEKMDYIGGGL